MPTIAPTNFGLKPGTRAVTRAIPAIVAPGAKAAAAKTDTAGGQPNNRPFRIVKIKVPAGGAPVIVGASGRSFALRRCINAAGQAAGFLVTVDANNGSSWSLEYGLGTLIFDEPFSQLVFRNTNTTAVTVDALVGLGDCRFDGANVIPPNEVSGEFNRPAGALVYAAGQSVGSGLNTLTDAMRATSSDARLYGTITRARLYKQSNVTANASFRCHLYDPTTAPGPFVDGAAWVMAWADRAKLVPFLDFPAFVTGGAGSDAAVCELTNMQVPVSIAPGFTALYWQLEAQAAYSAAALEGFRLDLTIEQK